MTIKKAAFVFISLHVFITIVYAQAPLAGGFYRDTTGIAPIQQIANASFAPITFPYELHPQTDEAYWIRLNLKNSEKFLTFSDWSYIDFFTQDSSGIWVSKHTGHLVPYVERDIPLNNRLIIEIPPGASSMAYIRLRFSPNSIRIPTAIQFTNVSAAQLVDGNATGNFVGPFLQGFILCILVFLVFLYYFSRDKALIIFGLYLLLWVYTISHNSGHLIASFPFFNKLPAYIPYLDIFLSSSLITIVAILVMYRLIDVKTYFAREKRFFDFLIVMLVLLPGVALFTSNKHYIVLFSYSTISLAVAGFLYISIFAYLKKIPFSLFFLLANLPFFIGTLVYLFSATGFINLPSEYHDLFLLVGVLCQSIFFTMIFSFRYNRLAVKNTQKKLTLSQQNRQLSSMTLNLTRKNTVLENVKKLTKRSASEPELKPLLRMIEEDLAFDNNWEDFKLHFEKVNQGFFNKLLARHPNLTANDQKLCAYLKLSLSSKEIARLQHRPVSSIEKARYRLRKKMGLDSGQNLSSYLHYF